MLDGFLNAGIQSVLECAMSWWARIWPLLDSCSTHMAGHKETDQQWSTIWGSDTDLGCSWECTEWLEPDIQLGSGMVREVGIKLCERQSIFQNIVWGDRHMSASNSSFKAHLEEFSSRKSSFNFPFKISFFKNQMFPIWLPGDGGIANFFILGSPCPLASHGLPKATTLFVVSPLPVQVVNTESLWLLTMIFLVTSCHKFLIIPDLTHISSFTALSSLHMDSVMEHSSCYEVMSPAPPKTYWSLNLLSNSLECGIIRRRGRYKSDEVKMRFIEWILV